MVSLPKISLGTSTRKSHFDLSHDVETTSEFGFCQPSIVRELIPHSSFNLKSNAFVRLAPLPCPTFGRIKLEQFNSFVPIKEVFEAFDYMQAQQTVASSQAKYIPTTADTMQSSTLFKLLLMSSLKDGTDNYLKPQGFLNCYIACPSLSPDNIINDPDTTGHGLIVDSDTYIPSGSDADGSSSYIGYTSALIGEIAESCGGVDFAEVFADSFTNYSNSTSTPGFSSFFGLDSVNNAQFRAEPKDMHNALVSPDDDTEYWDSVYYASYRNMSSPTACDFFAKAKVFGTANTYVTKVTISGVTSSSGDSVSVTVPFVLCCNLTRKGQRLMKILTACGTKSFKYDNPIDLVKIYAYYKAYFDLMNPGRTQQWRDTNCYRLIHSFYDYGRTLQSWFDDSDPDSEVNFIQLFLDFLTDLSNCFYSLPIDNVTAAQSDPVLKIDSNIGNIDLHFNTTSGNTSISGGFDSSRGSNSLSLSYGNLVGSNVYAGSNIGGLGVRFLEKVYNLVNKNSVIGSKIEDYLRQKYGYSIPKSNFIGKSEYNVSIDDTFATVQNDQTYLGEYAGRGVGYGNDTLKFEADEFGIFVQFFAIVPFGGYVQGQPYPHLTRFDYYQPEFDSLGMAPIRNSEVNGRSSMMSGGLRTDTTFGFLPRYFEMKIQNNLHNGGFAFRSMRQNFLPYSLDRLFNEDDIVTNSNVNTYYGTNLVPDEKLRYIGKYEEYGNYDRIFYDTTGAFDNFIVHMVNDWDYYAPMIPVRESWETFDKETDDNSTNVSKS